MGLKVGLTEARFQEEICILNQAPFYPRFVMCYLFCIQFKTHPFSKPSLAQTKKISLGPIMNSLVLMSYSDFKKEWTFS